jgi:hypothetical protein
VDSLAWGDGLVRDGNNVSAPGEGQHGLDAGLVSRAGVARRGGIGTKQLHVDDSPLDVDPDLLGGRAAEEPMKPLRTRRGDLNSRALAPVSGEQRPRPQGQDQDDWQAEKPDPPTALAPDVASQGLAGVGGDGRFAFRFLG